MFNAQVVLVVAAVGQNLQIFSSPLVFYESFSIANLKHVLLAF